VSPSDSENFSKNFEKSSAPSWVTPAVRLVLLIGSGCAAFTHQYAAAIYFVLLAMYILFAEAE
jgi:hypothetical protein